MAVNDGLKRFYVKLALREMAIRETERWNIGGVYFTKEMAEQLVGGEPRKKVTPEAFDTTIVSLAAWSKKREEDGK